MNLETLNQTNTKTKITVIISFATDFILMLAGIAFNFTFLIVPPIGIILLLIVIYIALSRRNPQRQKNIFVKIIFIIFIITTIDVIIFMQTSAYGWHPLFLLIILLSYIFTLYFRSVKFLQWDKLQCLLIPLIVTFIISTAGDAPLSKSKCQYITSQPEVKVLIDNSFYGTFKVRYILHLKNSPLILLSYRKSIGVPSDSPTLNCFNFKTKKMTYWLPPERIEVIGLYQHPTNKNIYAVVVNKAGKHIDKKNISYLDFLVFDNLGNIKYHLPMPKGRAYAYSANIFLKDNLILIVTDSQSYQYNPQVNELKLIEGNTPIAYSTVIKGNYLYGAFAHSPLLFVLFPYSIIKYNLKLKKTEKKFKKNIFGYYEIQEIGKSANFLASHLWIGGGIILDANLNVKSRVNIPKGVRNFAIDPKGRYLYAPNFFTGYLYILDILKNKILPQKYYVGKGARFVQALNSKKLLIANSCGLMELSPRF